MERGLSAPGAVQKLLAMPSKSILGAVSHSGRAVPCPVKTDSRSRMAVTCMSSPDNLQEAFCARLSRLVTACQLILYLDAFFVPGPSRWRSISR